MFPQDSFDSLSTSISGNLVSPMSLVSGGKNLQLADLPMGRQTVHACQELRLGGGSTVKHSLCCVHLSSPVVSWALLYQQCHSSTESSCWWLPGVASSTSSLNLIFLKSNKCHLIVANKFINRKTMHYLVFLKDYLPSCLNKTWRRFQNVFFLADF